jgi:hypothetical protein
MKPQPTARSNPNCHNQLRSCTTTARLCSSDPPSLGGSSGRRRVRRKRKTQSTDDAHDRAEFGIAALSKSLVKALSVQARSLCNLAHATCTSDETKCVTYKIGVAGFERRRYVGNLTLFGTEIVGGIKSCLAHHIVSANVWARLMSRCCLRLSPPENPVSDTADIIAAAIRSAFVSYPKEDGTDWRSPNWIKPEECAHLTKTMMQHLKPTASRS